MRDLGSNIKCIIADVQFSIISHDAKQLESLLQLLSLSTNGANLITSLKLIRGATPLSAAIYQRFTDGVRILLNYGCDPNQMSVDHIGRKEPPLFSAVRLGYLEIIKLLLEDPRTDVNQTNFFGQSSIWWTVKDRRIDLFNLLINHPGFRIDLKNFSVQNSNPLYLALKYMTRGRRQMALILMQIGFSLCCVDDSEKRPSALHFLVNSRDECDKEILNKALESGVDPNELRRLNAKVPLNVPLSLKKLTRITIRDQLKAKTGLPLTTNAIGKLLPRMPNMLIDFLACQDWNHS